MLAMQAQDYAGGLWSIGLRTASATRSSIEAAHETGAFVRSWPMRGTLHFVAAEDLPWMLSLTGQRMVRSAEGRRRQLELDQGQFDRAESIARERMEGGATISRPELFEAWQQNRAAHDRPARRPPARGAAGVDLGDRARRPAGMGPASSTVCRIRGCPGMARHCGSSPCATSACTGRPPNGTSPGGHP